MLLQVIVLELFNKTSKQWSLHGAKYMKYPLSLFSSHVLIVLIENVTKCYTSRQRYKTAI